MPVGRDRARELFKAAKTGDVNAIERLLGTRKKGGGRCVSLAGALCVFELFQLGQSVPDSHG